MTTEFSSARHRRPMHATAEQLALVAGMVQQLTTAIASARVGLTAQGRHN